jgi:hypothetical protein
MDKKEIRVYLNGVLADTATGIVDYDPDAAKYAVGIGGDNRGGNEQYFKGAIRTITAYADVRTEKEIRAGMAAPNLNDYDLIAHYDLSSVSGNIIKDGSENGYDTVYTKTWFTDKEPVTDYAYSFCVVGDTQIVALNHPDEFHHIYDWIIANKDSKKIAHVFGLGDITDKSTDAEWALAKREINKLNGIVPTQVSVKKNVLLEEAGSDEKQRNPRLANSVTGKVSAANSYDDPTYIPDPTDLGKGSVSVGLGHDSKRDSNSAYVDGYVQADLAAVLQDPVIRSMSRPQVEKAVEQAKRRMQKAAAELDFPAAAKYRDEMWALQQYLKVWKD